MCDLGKFLFSRFSALQRNTTKIKLVV